MNTFLRSIFLAASLFTSNITSLQAATVSLALSTSEVDINLGNSLSLSGEITPSSDVGLPTDIYVAATLPNGSVFSLDSNRVWQSTLNPIANNFPLAKIHAPFFHSMQFPVNLPSGKYSFYLIAVLAGKNPLDTSYWLGYSMAPFTFHQMPLLMSVDGRYQAKLIQNGQTTINYQVTDFETGRVILTSNSENGSNNVKVGSFNADSTKFAAVYHYAYPGAYSWIGVWSTETGAFLYSIKIPGEYLRQVDSKVFISP